MSYEILRKQIKSEYFPPKSVFYYLGPKNQVLAKMLFNKKLSECRDLLPHKNRLFKIEVD